MNESTSTSDEISDYLADGPALDVQRYAVIGVSKTMMPCATPQHHAGDGSAQADAVASVPARKTLSVRAGAVVRGGSEYSKAASGAMSQAHSANLAHNGAIPLKRLTAGRREMKITHDGATYLLRVTKSNKLILTKEAVAALAVATT